MWFLLWLVVWSIYVLAGALICWAARRRVVQSGEAGIADEPSTTIESKPSEVEKTSPTL
jgi:hypothetical protein